MCVGGGKKNHGADDECCSASKDQRRKCSCVRVCVLCSTTSLQRFLLLLFFLLFLAKQKERRCKEDERVKKDRKLCENETGSESERERVCVCMSKKLFAHVPKQERKPAKRVVILVLPHIATSCEHTHTHTHMLFFLPLSLLLEDRSRKRRAERDVPHSSSTPARKKNFDLRAVSKEADAIHVLSVVCSLSLSLPEMVFCLVSHYLIYFNGCFRCRAGHHSRHTQLPLHKPFF